ncbi:MAG: hypothetical protein RI973_845, partial [Bacteroidota bacterium]
KTLWRKRLIAKGARGFAPRAKNSPSAAVWLRQTAAEGEFLGNRPACGRPIALSGGKSALVEQMAWSFEASSFFTKRRLTGGSF